PGLSGDFVALSMSDTGIGMSAEARERAFEPFFTTKEIGKGSGLGLSMVYGYMQQSGGAAAIESELGRGTTVTLYLPRAKADSVRAKRPEEVAEPGRHGGDVLLVEDDPDVGEVAMAMLEALGYNVRHVLNA